MRLLPCVLTLCALSAAAQVRRVAAIGVALEGAPEADAAYGARAISSAIQSDARFEWVSPAIQARDDGPGREAKAIEARRLFNQAREELDNLAIPKAIASLDTSIKAWEDSDLSIGVQGLLDALALRAIAALGKGDKGGFNNDAQRVLAISPDWTWDPSRLTPAAQAALDPLKKKSRSSAPVALELVSTPPNAWAYVDGTFRGVTPITVPGLAPGSHVVTLVAVGYELAQDKVFAGSGAAPTFTLKSTSRGKEMLARIGEVRAALEKGDVTAAASTLARFIQADELLVAGVRKKKDVVEIVLVRVLSDGTLIGQEELPLSSQTGMSDWQALAKGLLAKDAPAPKKVEPTHLVVEDLPTASHSGRRPFGWIAGAVAVAAVGTGVALGLSSKSRAADANKTPQVDTATYNSLAGQARLQANVADVMFGVAVVAAGASIFLLATGYSSDSESSDDESAGLMLGPTRNGAFVGLHGSF